MGKAFKQIHIKEEGNPHEGGYYHTDLGKIWYKGDGIWDAPLSVSNGHPGYICNPEWYFMEGFSEPAPPKSIIITCPCCKRKENTRVGKDIPDWWYSVEELDGRVQMGSCKYSFCSYECMMTVLNKIPEAIKIPDPYSFPPLFNAVRLLDDKNKSISYCHTNPIPKILTMKENQNRFEVIQHLNGLQYTRIVERANPLQPDLPVNIIHNADVMVESFNGNIKIKNTKYNTEINFDEIDIINVVETILQLILERTHQKNITHGKQ